jgi:hypothetical protein
LFGEVESGVHVRRVREAADERDEVPAFEPGVPSRYRPHQGQHLEADLGLELMDQVALHVRADDGRIGLPHGGQFPLRCGPGLVQQIRGVEQAGLTLFAEEVQVDGVEQNLRGRGRPPHRVEVGDGGRHAAEDDQVE